MDLRKIEINHLKKFAHDPDMLWDAFNYYTMEEQQAFLHECLSTPRKNVSRIRAIINRLLNRYTT